MNAQEISEYFICLIFGICSLISWNVWITIPEYFIEKLKGNGSIESTFAATFMIINLISLIPASFYNHAFNHKKQMYSGLVMLITVFLFTILLDKSTEITPHSFYICTLIAIGISSISTSFLSASFPLVSTWNPLLTQAVATGQGIAGTVPSIMNLILLIFPSKLITASNFNAFNPAAYFLTPVIFGILGIIGLFYLIQARVDTAHPHRTEIASEEDSNVSVHPVNAISNLESNSIIEDQSAPLLPQTSTTLSPNTSNQEVLTHSYMYLIQSSWKFILSIFVNFMITLSVFPAMTATIQSTTNFKLLVPVHFLAFNLSDLLGKFAAGFIHSIPRQRLHLLSYIRVIFPILFLFCNIVEPSSSPKISSRSFIRDFPILFNDISYIFIIFAFGLTNGFLATRLLIEAPRPAQFQPQEQEEYIHQLNAKDSAQISQFMVLSLTAGLAAGSLMSILVVQLLFGCRMFVQP